MICWRFQRCSITFWKFLRARAGLLLLIVVSTGCGHKHVTVAAPLATSFSYSFDDMAKVAKTIYACGKAQGVAETLDRTGPSSLAAQAHELSDLESCKAALKLIDMLKAK